MKSDFIKRVLVLEDQKNEQMILSRILKKYFDCEIFIADNGQTGLEIIEQKSPDLILLDIAMPIMDGMEMFEILKKVYPTNPVKVIAVTAITDKDKLEKLKFLGIHDILFKPLEMTKFLEKLGSLLPIREN